MKETNESQKILPGERTHREGVTRVLTGIKPTGDPHLGNYFGAIRPCIEFSQDPAYEVLLLCVDWHGLTDRSRIFEPGTNSAGMLAAFLVLGFNTKGNSLILQSDFPQIQEIAWLLSCVTAVGLLERAHAYKDAIASGKKPTAGLFYYPVLMAADIMTFDSQVVPVGQDQSQHLEYASDMSKSFNSAVGKNVLHEAQPLIQPTPLLLGTDGERKMSKSYQNTIPMFASKKEVEKRIKEVKTDSLGLDDPKNPDTCVVFQMLKSFGSEESIAHMKERLQKGTGYGYGHAKKDLFEEHERVFGVHREAYDHFVNSPKDLWKQMEPGYERAHDYANRVVLRARDSLQLLKLKG